MAYNLQPLITILEGILDPHQSRWIVHESNPQLQSLLNKATSLQHLLNRKSSFTKLDSQIREVAHQAEDIIESHMVHQMLSGSNFVRFTLFIPDLQQVILHLDSLMEQAEKLMEMEDTKMPRELHSAMEQLKLVDKKMSSSSSSSSVVVGIDEDLMQLKDRLTHTEKKLEIVPIVGMGGVGKTTLARKLYEDPFIVDHFDYRAWTTISQDYNMTRILLSLLSCIIGLEKCDQHMQKEIHELKDMLHKSLFGRKYLIVLDDVWSTKFWDEIRMYFPDNNNGSRIVITTRESDLANYASPLSSHHQVQLLSESESWNLLHQLMFGEEDCPLVLQQVGRMIAKYCGGLPLAISVIGGLLSKMERSEDDWKKIGDNVIAAIAESNERCYSILSLSYNHLPNHLKPCFLYMGAFPEDYEIRRSRLVRLWVAEGFIKSNGERSLEEEADDWLKSLVERNLFSVISYKKNGKPKSYNIHDMLRDVCIRKCDEDKFLYLTNGQVRFSNPRRMSFIISYKKEATMVPINYMLLTRSIIGNGPFKRARFPSAVFLMPRLLRVLDLLDTFFEEFPMQIFEFVNLSLLGIYCISHIPRGISRLRNLQTFHGHCRFDVPSELWQLSELRNLKVAGFELLKDEEMNYSVLEKLQIISTLKATTWDGLCQSIPNIKKLVIDGDGRISTAEIDLSHFDKLEILTCKNTFNVIFPCNIRKLVLGWCTMTPGVLKTLCALHKLEVLSIYRGMFAEGWEVADGDEFPSLQFLYLAHLFFVHWIADETNFPVLRHLCLRDCKNLEKIPSGIGEIPTLQLIELEECSESAVASAKRIEEEQSEYGNYDLKLCIVNKIKR